MTGESTKPHGGHRDDLQGLRAVAVLLVAIGHAGVSHLTGGFVGVDVFFVLSGFLITGLLLKDAAGGDGVSLAEFYKRRARRILPAAALTLVATDIAAYQLLNFVRARNVMWDSIWASFFAANVHFAQQGTDYFAQSQPPSPIQHFWTLAVEEQFYVVWPALLALMVVGVALSRRGFRDRCQRAHLGRGALRRLLIVAAVITATSLAWSIHTEGSTTSYFSTFARAWELGLGALLAIATLRRSIPAPARVAAGWAGLAAIIGAGLLYANDTPFPGFAALLPTLGAAGVIIGGIGGTPRLGLGRLLAIRPMRFVGDRSYTLYLWHWPFLIIPAEYVGHDLSTGAELAFVAAAFAVSVVTYAVFENPIRRMEWSGGASAFAFTASATVVVAVAATALTRIDDTIATRQAAAAPVAGSSDVDSIAKETARLDAEDAKLERALSSGSLPSVIRAVKAAGRAAPLPSPLYPDVTNLLHSEYYPPEGCEAHDGQTSSGICRLGSHSRRLLVVFGDSHVQMWMPAVLALAHRDGWSVVPLLKSGCTPPRWFGASARSECRTWFRWAMRSATKLNPTAALVGGAYSGDNDASTSATVASIASATSRLRPVVKHIVVLGDVPLQSRQPLDCLLSRNASMGTCTSTWTLDQQGSVRAVADFADRERIGFIDTEKWFCFEYQCPMVIGDTIVYFDPGHITATYAAELAGPFRRAFRRSIASA